MAATVTTTKQKSQQTTLPAMIPISLQESLTGIQEDMKKSSLKKHERYMQWEKNRVNKAVNQLILSQALPITARLIETAMEGNPQALNSLLDRIFGKASQNVEVSGNPEKPIVFMPAELMAKYAITQGTKKDFETPQYEELL